MYSITGERQGGGDRRGALYSSGRRLDVGQARREAKQRVGEEV